MSKEEAVVELLDARRPLLPITHQNIEKIVWGPEGRPQWVVRRMDGSNLYTEPKKQTAA